MKSAMKMSTNLLIVSSLILILVLTSFAPLALAQNSEKDLSDDEDILIYKSKNSEGMIGYWINEKGFKKIVAKDNKKDEEIKKLEELLTQKNKKIDLLKLKIDKKDKVIAGYKDLVAEKDEKIELIQQNKKEEIKIYEEQLKLANKQIDNLEAQVNNQKDMKAYYQAQSALSIGDKIKYILIGVAAHELIDTGMEVAK